MSERWTAADIPDQSGRVAVVTGANSGLGEVVTRELARAGAEVVMACRNVAKGEEVAADILSGNPRGSVEVVALDLGDLASVRTFAAAFKARHDHLDLLVNNAGIMGPPRRLTIDGFESQIGTNHLGHFALTGLLMPSLRAAGEPRVVTVSSMAHRTGAINFDDLHGARRYNHWVAYGQSKLANLMFANELDRRARSSRASVVSLAAHPGWAATHLQSAGPQLAHERVFMAVVNKLYAQSPEMGALPILYAATAPSVSGGTFVGPDGVMQGRGHPRVVEGSKRSQDAQVASRLWEVSERLTGVPFSF